MNPGDSSVKMQRRMETLLMRGEMSSGLVGAEDEGTYIYCTGTRGVIIGTLTSVKVTKATWWSHLAFNEGYMQMFLCLATALKSICMWGC